MNTDQAEFCAHEAYQPEGGHFVEYVFMIIFIHARTTTTAIMCPKLINCLKLFSNMCPGPSNYKCCVPNN